MGKGAREATARERIAALRQADRKKDRHRRLATMVTIATVAVLAIGGGAWYAAARDTAEQQTAAAKLAPTTVNADGTVTMARPGVTAPVLDVYEDFQCPACKALEESSGPTIKNLASEGKAKVVFHPITIFSMEPTKSNSVRAGAASRCVTDGAAWPAFHDRLFKEQPSETVEGFALTDLVAWGKDAGITSPGWESCVTSQKYAQTQLTQSDKVLRAEKITGTPTLKLNGKEMDSNVAFVPNKLRQAVLAAGK
ncbi:thioredoxin domain-containing protein [Herbidospora daliensis]|uniref:thioredoxin domain-containing protein n=1 Tax=Herbidospora daliensis TaxID=295585 RepID=UPI000786184F|nr:thioredoxin domain-containing protein [Herbidospora daliensis]